MSKTVNIKILLRNDTAANWASNNPILAKGELGVEIDTKKFKFGDGITPWNVLDYGAGADIPIASSTQDGLLSKEDYNKLSEIEAGAEANVQSDWAATTGDAAILNKPTTLEGYGITDAMTEEQIKYLISQSIASVFIYKGTEPTVQDLPESGNNIGDVRHIMETGGQYVWNGYEWEELGPYLDLSNFLQKITIAGYELTSSNSDISITQLQQALELGTAAYKNIKSIISEQDSDDDDIPTIGAVKTYATEVSTKVEASEVNGNIKVNDVETTVYTLPDTVLDSSDILLLDCGNATANYS